LVLVVIKVIFWITRPICIIIILLRIDASKYFRSHILQTRSLLIIVRSLLIIVILLILINFFVIVIVFFKLYDAFSWMLWAVFRYIIFVILFVYIVVRFVIRYSFFNQRNLLYMMPIRILFNLVDVDTDWKFNSTMSFFIELFTTRVWLVDKWFIYFII